MMKIATASSGHPHRAPPNRPRTIRPDSHHPVRPPTVKTSCERFSLARSATTSIAAPRRTQERNGTRSTTSPSSGHASGGMG